MRFLPFDVNAASVNNSVDVSQNSVLASGQR